MHPRRRADMMTSLHLSLIVLIVHVCIYIYVCVCVCVCVCFPLHQMEVFKKIPTLVYVDGKDIDGGASIVIDTHACRMHTASPSSDASACNTTLIARHAKNGNRRYSHAPRVHRCCPCHCLSLSLSLFFCMYVCS